MKIVQLFFVQGLKKKKILVLIQYHFGCNPDRIWYYHGHSFFGKRREAAAFQKRNSVLVMEWEGRCPLLFTLGHVHKGV